MIQQAFASSPGLILATMATAAYPNNSLMMEDVPRHADLSLAHPINCPWDLSQAIVVGTLCAERIPHAHKSNLG